MSAPDIQELLGGNRRTLAKAITLIESQHRSHREQADALMAQLLPHAGRSLRIGISGTPGVGKSTFIQVFGEIGIDHGHRVAVLAIDPSSPVAGGSILGDKTRMPRLASNPRAFVRPSPTEGQLGGVAQRTREAMLVCEAAGFDIVLVETVGVGQSEVDVAGMVDVFLVLMQPNAGDELQGIKKGVLELADALVVNKADGEGKRLAEQSVRHYQSALGFVKRPGFWQPRVLMCSAQEETGITEVWQTVRAHQNAAKSVGGIEKKRAKQNAAWMQTLFSQLIERKLTTHPEHRALRTSLELSVAQGKTTPLAAAQQLANLLTIDSIDE